MAPLLAGRVSQLLGTYLNPSSIGVARVLPPAEPPIPGLGCQTFEVLSLPRYAYRENPTALVLQESFLRPLGRFCSRVSAAGSFRLFFVKVVNKLHGQFDHLLRVCFLLDSERQCLASLHCSVRRRFLWSLPFQFPFLGMSGRCTRALTTGDNRRVGISGLPLLRGSGLAIFLTTATGTVSKCVKDFRI